MAAAPLRPLGAPPSTRWPSTRGPSAPTAGPRVDRRRPGHLRGRVSRYPGLYAAGNTAANVFGWAYPSGGATIAHGVTFGYRAGRHVAAQGSRPALALASR